MIKYECNKITGSKQLLRIACGKNINQVFNQLDGIPEIGTSHKTGMSEIKYDKNKPGLPAIENSIKPKGYEINVADG